MSRPFENDPFTMERRLCDDDGMVSDAPVPNAFDSRLTYLRQINNLRAHTGLSPVTEPFHCTGSAHLAAEHILCPSPAHNRSAATRQIIWGPNV